MARVQRHEWPADPAPENCCPHCNQSYAAVVGRGLKCNARDEPDRAAGRPMPAPARRVYACEDGAAIALRLEQLAARRERRCFARAGWGAGECWCLGAGEGGVTLPCPPIA